MGVVLFHLGLGCPGGYVGVDVFFVISGFLITRLVMAEQSRGAFTLSAFWARRMRRLFPALAVVLAFTLAAASRWFLPQDFQEYGESLAAQGTLTSNVFFWMKAGYFDSTADVKPLLHTWSLAIEEQFYLFFPLLFVFGRNAIRRTLIAVLAAVFIVSFSLSVAGSYRHPSATFYLLPTRAWELALGALLCFLPAPDGAWAQARRLAPWAGLAAIVCALILYSSATRFPGAAALLPCGGTALLVWGTSRGSGLVGRALSARPLVFIGLISYSLYLWHWPLLVFWHYLQPRPAFTLQDKLALLATAFAMATLSYYLVELPIRTRRVLASTPLLVWSSVAATLVFVLAGATIHAQRGLPSRLPEACVQLAAPDVDPLLFAQTSLDDLRRDRVPLLTGEAAPARTHSVDVLLWGDSHANSIAPVVRALAAERRLTSAMIVHPATAPLLDFSRDYPDALVGRDALEFTARAAQYVRDHSVKRVLIAAAWEAYAIEATDDRPATTFDRTLARTVDEIRAAGAEVWLIKDVPGMPFNVPRALSRACVAGGDIAALRPSLAAYAADHAVVNHAIDARQSPRVHVLDPVPFFADGRGRLLAERDAHALFMDNAHLTRQGAQLLRPLFETVVAAAQPPTD
jgi:peptidoglycan/LPS O-acetylase OafA/YrhL